VHGTFILGLPGETKETIEETIRFAREVNPHTLQVSVAAPYPGTELYRQAVENGWLPPDDQNSTLVSEHGTQLAALSYPELNRTEIFDSVDAFYRRFYFRAGKIAEMSAEMFRSPRAAACKRFRTARPSRRHSIERMNNIPPPGPDAPVEPVVIIGAGPAGLAAAARLGQLGVPAEILECGESVASSWRQRYDRLRMNTCRWNIMLWFGRFPRRTSIFPTRDEFVRYMESYVSRHDLKVRFGVKVDRIDRVADGWRLATSAGEQMARDVIVATGHGRLAKLPGWAGHDRFPGHLLHSAEYRNPSEFRGKDVVVVGSGCSGMEIAGDLAHGGAGKVRLAVRTPPHIVLRTSAWGPNDLLAAALQRLPTWIADSVDAFIRHKTVGDLTPYGLNLPGREPFPPFAEKTRSPRSSIRMSSRRSRAGA
jgi:hypothetical protein